MDKTTLQLTQGLTPTLGYSLLVGLGLAPLVAAIVIRRLLVRNTHDFIISDRKIGFGFGVGSVISVWTWSMAVMMTSAMTFEWGLSGLFWFVAPNGLAVMMLIPFTRVLRRQMPNGYTISEFTKNRFKQSGVATSIVTLTMVFGIVLEILINLKGASVVMSTIFNIDWTYAALVGLISVLVYSYFGGLWTSVMTATINLLMITVPAAIIVSLAFDKVPGGALAVVAKVGEVNPANLSVLRWDAAAGFGTTLAFGIFAAAIADQTFWQNGVGDQIGICQPHLPLGRRAVLSHPDRARHSRSDRYRIRPEPIGYRRRLGGDRAVSDFASRPAVLIIIGYVLMILAACYSTIDGAGSALSSIVAVDIVKRFAPRTAESRLFVITKISTLIGGLVAFGIVLSGVDFTTLVLTTYALKTSILLPLVLAILWPRTNTIGFVGGIVLAIGIGMPLRHVYGDLVGTISIVAISGLTVVLGALIRPERFDYAALRQSTTLDANATADSALPGAVTAPAE